MILQTLIDASKCVSPCAEGLLFFWKDELKLLPWRVWKFDPNIFKGLDEPPTFQKVKGYSLLEGPISEWVSNNLFDGWYVLLYDINTEFLAPGIWMSMPNETRLQFLQDIVVLHCKSAREAISLRNSIEPGFAKAHMINHGLLLD